MFGVDQKEKVLLATILGLVWAVHGALVWLHPFVPSTDYPQWLLQANILANYTDPGTNFAHWYLRVGAPIPNGGFVIPVALLTNLLPVELAGKILITFYLIAFPLAMLYCARSLGNQSALWLASILLLFNASFLNGNFAFLVSLCMLLVAIGLEERMRSRQPSATIWVGSLLSTTALFFAHSMGAVVFLIYLCVRIGDKNSQRAAQPRLLANAALLVALGIAYYFARPVTRMPSEFAWGFDVRYRISVLAKSFTAGIAFPPYEFSPVRTLANAIQFVFVVVLGAVGVRLIRSTWTISPVAKLATIVLALSLVAPKAVLGIGESSQRLALTGFILWVSCVLWQSARAHRALLRALALVAILVCIVRWTDYRTANGVLERRFNFLQRELPACPTAMTLDDDLGARAAPSFYLMPKGVSLVFQTDYHVLSCGYDPGLFRTGYVLPRDDGIFAILRRTQAGGEDNLRALTGEDIPGEISYLIFDGSAGWTEDMAEQMKPQFVLQAATDIAPGLKTTLLARVFHGITGRSGRTAGLLSDR